MFHLCVTYTVRVQVYLCQPTECGPAKCPPSHHTAGCNCQVPGAGPGGGANSTHSTVARVIVHVLNSPSDYSSSAGTCRLQTTSGIHCISVISDPS